MNAMNGNLFTLKLQQAYSQLRQSLSLQQAYSQIQSKTSFVPLHARQRQQ